MSQLDRRELPEDANRRKLMLTVNDNLLRFASLGGQQGVSRLSIQVNSVMTTVGERIRELRKQNNLTQRELARKIGMNFTYLSKIENDRLDDEQTPREDTLRTIADALSADVDELLLLARRVPLQIQERILEMPTVFRKLVSLSNSQLEELMTRLDEAPKSDKPR